MRYALKDMNGVRRCLEFQPADRKVQADPDTGVTEKTVRELRARRTRPPGLVLVVPTGDWPELTVDVVKSDL